MNIQIEFWQLVTLFMALIGLALGGAKFLFDQIDRRLNDRFQALEESRKSADIALRDELRRHSSEEAKAVDEMKKLERDFLTWRAEIQKEFANWRADLPNLYVRREDYVRNQTILELKIDKIFEKLETIQVQGAKHG